MCIRVCACACVSPLASLLVQGDERRGSDLFGPVAYALPASPSLPSLPFAVAVPPHGDGPLPVPESMPRGGSLRVLRGLRKSVAGGGDPGDDAARGPRVQHLSPVISDVDDGVAAKPVKSPLVRVRLCALTEHRPPATLSPTTLRATAAVDLDFDFAQSVSRAGLASRSGARKKPSSLKSPSVCEVDDLPSARFNFVEAGSTVIARPLPSVRSECFSPLRAARQLPPGSNPPSPTAVAGARSGVGTPRDRSPACLRFTFGEMPAPSPRVSRLPAI